MRLYFNSIPHGASMWPHGFRIRGFFLTLFCMNRERISCFIDGFNLYHALRELRKPHLKWLDLSKLMEHLFSQHKSQIITKIYFFSAYPTWKKDSYERHRKYVSALSATGVIPILGKFKNKDRKCPNCHYKWKGHEEKESDVNIALALLNEAYRDRYDHAAVISRDSDLAPAIRMVLRNFSGKKVTIISPFNLRHSSELLQSATNYKTIKLRLIETSLFPEEVYDAGGNLVVCRPKEYTPKINIHQFVDAH